MQKVALALRMAVLTLSGVLCLASWASAGYTDFHFSADRFEADGNVLGPHDGTLDFVDEFDDGSLSPNWYKPFGTAYESGGLLHLTAPGTHYPGPNGTEIVISDVVSAFTLLPDTWIEDGRGDLTATAYWEPIIPEPGEMYHLTLFTFGGSASTNELFGVDIHNEDSVLAVQQHLIHLDQASGTYDLVQTWPELITEGDVTGQIVFRISFDDATNMMQSSYSLDSGVTFESPFPSAPIFQDGRTSAQFIIGAHPEVDASTTTTTSTSSTTTTTLPPPGQQMKTGKLLLVKNPKASDPTKRKIVYKVKERASANTVVGNPITSGAKLKIKLDGNTDCYNMPASGWSAISTLGFKYKDARGAYGPVKVASIKKTPSGNFMIKAKVFANNGLVTVVPPNPGIQADTNFSLGEGDEYCSTFGGTLGPNNEKTFRAKDAPAPTECNVSACSPSGAFLDVTATALE